jgi:hypothetical protein
VTTCPKWWVLLGGTRRHAARRGRARWADGASFTEGREAQLPSEPCRSDSPGMEMPGCYLARQLGQTLDSGIVGIAISPRFSRLVRTNHRMLGAVKMCGGMAMGRVVATTHVATGQAQSQMHPVTAHLQTLLATRSARLDTGLSSGGRGEMRTRFFHARGIALRARREAARPCQVGARESTRSALLESAATRTWLVGGSAAELAAPTPRPSSS